MGLGVFSFGKKLLLKTIVTVLYVIELGFLIEVVHGICPPNVGCRLAAAGVG